MNLDASGGPMDAEEFIRLWDAQAMTIERLEDEEWIQDRHRAIWRHNPTNTYWEVVERRYGSVFVGFNYDPNLVVKQVQPYVEVVEVTKYAPI